VIKRNQMPGLCSLKMINRAFNADNITMADSKPGFCCFLFLFLNHGLLAMTFFGKSLAFFVKEKFQRVKLFLFIFIRVCN
jgi:uncharacterized membrane protein